MIGQNRRRGLMGGVDERDFVLVEATHCGLTARILRDSYNAGWIASPDRLMMSEAKNILTIDTMNPSFAGSRNTYTDFSWFQYLENVNIVSTYSYWYYHGFLIVPPYAVSLLPGIRRFGYYKIILLSRNPRPLFNESGINASRYDAERTLFYEDNYSTIYVPDDSYDAWLPYIQASANCPSWMSNNGITCARISDLTAEEQARIKIPY